MELIRILSRFGKRYAGEIIAVITLQLITTLATLYLPDLNADIINNGVAQADVDYICLETSFLWCLEIFIFGVGSD